MESLLDIGIRCSTDKVDHEYLSHYERRFAERRGDPVTVLEIGIMDGASLRTWRDFFPRGLIYGIDIRGECMVTEDRIESFRGKQEDAKFLSDVIATTGDCDIIIDDGSHCGSHHVASFEVLWSHLKPGGWYAVEDAITIFNRCWTQKKDRTILDIVREQWAELLRCRSDVAEIAVIGCGTQRPKYGRNNGLVFIQKAILSTENEVETTDGEWYFTEGDRHD